MLFLPLIIAAITPGSAKAQSRIQQFDERVLIDMAKTRTPEKTGVMMFLSNTYKYGDIGIPAALFAGGVIGGNKEMRQNSLYVASSTAVSYGLTMLIKQIVKRQRPFIRNVTIIPVYRAERYSFPSGHTSSTIATATALSLTYPKWYVIAPSFLWAGSVGYSRMYLGVHYPTDVTAGAILGAGSAVSMRFLSK